MESDSAYAKVVVRRAGAGNAEEIEAAVEELFARLPAAERLHAGSHVLLKPNLMSDHLPGKAVTTHPDVLRAVIQALKRRGVENITVADSPGGPYTPAVMAKVYKTCGITAVCEEMGAALYTACESEARPTDGALVKQFTLIRPVLEADFIINLPKMKTHVLTGMSGAVKNLFGCVPGLQKAEFHMRFPQQAVFADMLLDLCETVRADMHIVDGIIAMEGDGPGSGQPKRCNLLFAGQNPYTLDVALCRAMGLDAERMPLLAAAARRGLGPAELDENLLEGEQEALRPIDGFVPPQSYVGRVDFSRNLPRPFRPLVSFLGQRVAPKPKVVRKKCIGCGKCAEICPQQVIALRKHKAEIRYQNCIRCFCCHEICPAKAVEVKRFGLFGL